MEAVPPLRDPLDYLLGVVYGLWFADELGFDNRDSRLPNDYWRIPLKRARDMADAQGDIRRDGKWAAGFYFNSALLRIAASYHKVLKALTKRGREYVPDLLKLVSSFPNSNLNTVHCEVNDLKHATNGLEPGRKVTFDIAIRAVDELIDFVESHRAEF